MHEKSLKVFAANLGRRSVFFPLVSPPLGIMYLAAHLRNKFNASLKLVNQRLDNLSNDEIVKNALDFKTDIVLLCALTPAAKYLEDICAKLKDSELKPFVIIGGPHVSSFGAESLKAVNADIAVAGEGEMVLEEIVRCFLGDRNWGSIPGIFWKREDGSVISNPGTIPVIENLDSLPYPAYDLIDLPAYWRRQSSPPIPRRQYISLMSSRGCPYSCKWCHCVFGRKFRGHSAERIVDEIQYYQRKYGIRDFEFLDDIFNMDHKRVKDFCGLIQKKNIKIKFSFSNGVRADILEREEIDALVDCGLYFSSFALETGSPRLQKVMGKNLNIDRFLDNVEYASKKGVFCNGFAMLGFPTETEEDLQKTIDVACQSLLHTISFFTLIPFPNTDIYDMALEKHADLLRKIDYTDSNYANSRVNVSEVPDDILWRYQRQANKKFFNLKRIARIVRDYPKPLLLPLYVPIFIERRVKGLFK